MPYTKPPKDSDLPKLYDAFISYSHSSDQHIAPILQRSLQTFAKPWWRIHAANIFRDETNLSASPHAWPDIKQALDAASNLILLASPKAAQSKWVRKELCYWLTGGNKENEDNIQPQDIDPDRVKHLLIVLTDGTICWDDAQNSLNFKLTTALPTILAGVFTFEPLWVDLSDKAITDDPLDRKNIAYMQAVARLASPIRNIPLAMLVGQDYKQHRRTIRTIKGVALLLSGLSITALIFAWLAEDRRKIADSRRLAIQSEIVGKTNPDLGLLLSGESYRTKPTAAAEGALLNAIQQFPRLTTILRGHSGTVSSLAFTSNGESLYSASVDHSIRHWELKTSKFRLLAAKHHAAINQIALNTFHEQLISVSDDSAVGFWQIKDNISHGKIHHESIVKSIAISPDGMTAATGDLTGNIILWDLPNGTYRQSFKAHNKAVFDLIFHPTNPFYLFSSSWGEVFFWDLSEQIFKARAFNNPSKNQNWKLAIHPGGKQLVSCSEDGYLHAWQLPYSGISAKGEMKRLFKNGCLSIAYSPDGHLLAASSSNGLITLKNLSIDEEQTWQRHRSLISALAFSPDSRLLASGEKESIMLWDVSTQHILAKTLYKNTTGNKLFLASGKASAIVLDNNEILQWKMSDYSKSLIKIPKISDKILAVTFLQRPRILFKDPGYKGPPVLKSQEQIDSVKVGVDIIDAVWNDSGNILVTSDTKGMLNLYDAKLNFISALRSPAGPVEGLSINQNGDWIVALDPHLQIWKKSQQDPVLSFDKYYHASAISADDRWIALAKTRKLELFDFKTEKFLTLDGSENLSAFALTFSPDSTRLVSAGTDELIYLWDIESKQLIGQLSGHSDPKIQSIIRKLTFTSDAHYLFSLADDGRLLSWNMDPDKWLEITQKAVNREFYSSERSTYLDN